MKPLEERPASPFNYGVTLVAVILIGVGVAASMLVSGRAQEPRTGREIPNDKTPKQAAPKARKNDTTKSVPKATPIIDRTAILSLPGAEMVAYDAVRKRAYVTCAKGLAVVQLAFDATPTVLQTIDVVAAAGFPRGITGSATHVSIDPAGRGLAAVTVVPIAKARLPGAVVFVRMDDGACIGAVNVGYNPDALAFSPSGAQLVVVNEGEPEVVRDILVDPPGSVSIIDLASIKVPEDASKLSPSDVIPLGFHGSVISTALARMATGEQHSLRIHPAAKHTPDLDIEPESLAVDGDRAYVTLQENNGLGVIDLKAYAWTAIKGLPGVERLMDASDKDGGVKIDDTFRSLPCPDQIATFTANSRTYLAMCEEGDDRGDADASAPPPLADQARLAWLASQGRLAPTFMSGADLSDNGVGRLRVCAFSGDPNGDGSINYPVAIGTRSVGIYDAQTLARVGDTGAQLEQLIAKVSPTLFNADGADLSKPDARSDDRGPEPEGITIAEINGRAVAFVSLERPGAIAVVDLRTPADPRVLEVVMTTANGDTSPEGLIFVPANASPTAKPLLLVAFEGSGGLGVYRVQID